MSFEPGAVSAFVKINTLRAEGDDVLGGSSFGSGVHASGDGAASSAQVTRD